jgi:hypothetical protein
VDTLQQKNTDLVLGEGQVRARAHIGLTIAVVPKRRPIAKQGQCIVWATRFGTIPTNKSC